MTDNDNCDLMDMYWFCNSQGWTDGLVETDESIRNDIAMWVTEGYPVADLLMDVERNQDILLFEYDRSLGNMGSANPICSKKELMEILL